jgi:hypothetical protein
MEMDNKEIRERILENIRLLEDKESNIYFMTMDSKGSPSAAIANIYENVKILREMGYNAHILHQQNDYKLRADAEGNGLAEWLGEEYVNLPHVSIQDQNLKVTPSDFIIVPEIMGGVLKDIKNVPSKKILFVQTYNYLLEPYTPQENFNFITHGVKDVITTTEKQKEFINGILNNQTNVEVIPVGIPEYFKPSEKPKKPIVGIVTRDQRDTMRFVKNFYTKYPQFKFISFRDLRGISREQFAKDISELCCMVWIDDISSFGTVPVESMKCNVPVIGRIPDMVPDWMTDTNGYWSHSTNNLIDITYKFVQAWLEDAEPAEIYEEMSKMKDEYTVEKQKAVMTEVYERMINNRIEEFKLSLPQEEEGEVIEISEVDNKEEEVKEN